MIMHRERLVASISMQGSVVTYSLNVRLKLYHDIMKDDWRIWHKPNDTLLHYEPFKIVNMSTKKICCQRTIAQWMLHNCEPTAFQNNFLFAKCISLMSLISIYLSSYSPYRSEIDTADYDDIIVYIVARFFWIWHVFLEINVPLSINKMKRSFYLHSKNQGVGFSK